MKTFMDQIRERDLVEELARVLARHHVTAEELRGRDQSRHVTRARAAFVAALRALGWSYPAIGRLIGRDHSTCVRLAETAKELATKETIALDRIRGAIAGAAERLLSEEDR